MRKLILSIALGLLMPLVILTAHRASAQTFRIDGPKVYNFTAAAMNVSIILKNNTAASYKIYAWIENNTDGQIEFYPNIINMLDTSVSVGSEIIVNFIARGPAIVNARIILFDSVATRDTIYINGKDTLYHDPSRPYRLYTMDNKEIKGGTGDTTHYIYFTHDGVGKEFPMRIKNYSASPIAMTPTYIGWANGFSVTPNMFTLDVYPSNAMSIDIIAGYTPTGNQYDTAILLIKSIDPLIPQDTLVFIGRNIDVFDPAKLAGDTVDVGVRGLDITENYMFTIRNPTKRMVTITDADESGDANKCFTAPLGSMVNKVFMPGDTANYIVTYKAPARKEVTSEVLFTIAYTTNKGETGFIYYKYIAHTRSCYTQNPPASLVMEPAIPGGYTKATFTIRNNDDKWVELKSIYMGDGAHTEYFTIDTPATLPIYLDGWKETEFTVRFTPKDSVVGMAYVPLTFEFNLQNFDTVCRTMSYELRSSTTVIPLYPNQTASLPMASEKDTMTKRFRFQNNLTVPVTILSAEVSDSGHFTITSTDPAGLPVVIEPNEMFTVDVLFAASDTGYYSDDLVIVTDHAFTSQVFHLKALRVSQLPVAVTQPKVVTGFLHITPNPALNGSVQLSAPFGTKKITIYNALGDLIAQTENTPEWNWAALSNSGTPVSSGVYFVRAEGLSNNGKPFVISKRLVIEK
jgi:hypothetical protein